MQVCFQIFTILPFNFDFSSLPSYFWRFIFSIWCGRQWPLGFITVPFDWRMVCSWVGCFKAKPLLSIVITWFKPIDKIMECSFVWWLTLYLSLLYFFFCVFIFLFFYVFIFSYSSGVFPLPHRSLHISIWYPSPTICSLVCSWSHLWVVLLV